MTKASVLLATLLTVQLATVATARAAATDPLSCTVGITTTLNGTTALVYNQTFVVSPTAPYSDDFSTATRFRFFDAWMTVEAGVPVVKIQLDADVSVFDAVDFVALLKVRDSHGESTDGSSSFFTSTRSGRTQYTLSCGRAG